MDISQLWSTYPGIVVGVVVVVGIVAIVCCCCCCRSSATRKHTYHGNWVTTSDLESGPLNDFELPKRPPNVRTKRDYTLVETDGPEDYPDFPAHTVSEIERPVTQLPHEFYNFITQKIIPYFNDQRIAAYQFAVVVLLSESDFDNICQTSFTPSDNLGRPILNKAFSVMPQDLKKYGNYVVARPSINSHQCHSEEAIFEKYSVIDSPFSHLWSAYVERNGAYPKCILIYSWNLPCSRCTEAIIRSLGEKPYNSVSVIVAHTQLWLGEFVSDWNKNREKLASKNITVQQIRYPIRLSPA